MKYRSIILCIILSIITCGFYSIYWFISLTNELNTATGRSNDTSGGISYILTLVTCGIYGFFWSYKLGEKRDILARRNDYSNIVYLVLYFLGLNIITLCLAQDTMNKALGGR